MISNECEMRRYQKSSKTFEALKNENAKKKFPFEIFLSPSDSEHK